ncbi:hypothetical protein EYF80_057348 [Liparis tanakae]|uniref:Uncharacterized protein n=1 Tax=Liparis tanakae TaxID=230148 RepID=A0A4Z2EV11_9TELE|nr:hypothetical protein EYF80_057348 [Liparis tanakae]
MNHIFEVPNESYVTLSVYSGGIPTFPTALEGSISSTWSAANKQSQINNHETSRDRVDRVDRVDRADRVDRCGHGADSAAWPELGPRAGGSGLGVQGWGFRAVGSGLWVQGWGFRAVGSGLGVQGFPLSSPHSHLLPKPTAITSTSTHSSRHAAFQTPGGHQEYWDS